MTDRPASCPLSNAMNRPKKKELTAAERWKENNGSALMIIGLGLAIVGASVTRLHMISKRDEPSEPATLDETLPGNHRLPTS